MSRSPNWYCLVCRGKMSIHEDNGEDPTEEESQERFHVLVATTCGHLFHKSCLVKFCDARRSHQEDICLPVAETNVCPSCDREIKLADCRRIFPTELPEDLGLENLSLGNEPELLRKIEELTCEINQLKAKTKLQENKIAAFESGRRVDRTQSTSTGASQSDYSQARSQLQGMGYAIDELPDGSPGLSLKRGDAVVWVTDANMNGNAGIVRWLGQIDTVFYAGIEFDDPVGNDFAQSNGVILLETQLANTGTLVRVQELMLYKDFHGHAYYPPEPRF